MKFSDIDYSKRKINISRAAVKVKGSPTQLKPPKDYETRTVTVNSACLELIDVLKADKQITSQRLGTQWVGDDWLFTQWNGEIMNPQTPTKQWANFLKRHNLPHKKFHSLRHSSATLLLFGGVNLKQVQSRLGHSKIETTNKYLHAIEDADVQASDILDAMLTINKDGNIRQLKKAKKKGFPNIGKPSFI